MESMQSFQTTKACVCMSQNWVNIQQQNIIQIYHSYSFLDNHQITSGPVGPHRRKRHMSNGRPFWWCDDVTGSTVICPRLMGTGYILLQLH